MEDVLEVYHRPFDPARPLVCFDEAAKQLLADVRAPLPMRPGCPQRQDGEYKRQGTAALFPWRGNVMSSYVNGARAWTLPR
jgi:hypothetical protein